MSLSLIRRVLLSIGLSLALAAPAPAVQGTLRDDAGRPASGAWIVARDLSRPMRINVRTDANGAFRLPLHNDRPYAVDAGLGWNFTTLVDSLPAGAEFPGSLALPATPAKPETTLHSSSHWLGAFPNSDEKRRFILDCTGCHQFNETRAFYQGGVRARERWTEDVARMLTYAGATTHFPVISEYRNPERTAAWLTDSMAKFLAGSGKASPAPRASNEVAAAVITEYDLPMAGDLPHDLAVDASGHVVITGMFTHAMYRLSPETGDMASVAIPVDKANPRAVVIDDAGDWWVLLGGPRQIARYKRANDTWDTFPIEMYPHSIAITTDGRSAWFNGHFTRDPELIGRLDVASGMVTTHAVPMHPTMGAIAGGPIPYEQRLGPDGTIYMSELQGNRIVAFDPATGSFRIWEMPLPFSGPRRFDVAPNGDLWIPAYSANRLVRLVPSTGVFTEHELPIPDSVPYIARVDPRSGDVWVGTAAADVIYRFHPDDSRFTSYPLPTRGATIRHIDIDPRNGDVWLAYGASPAIHPARVARLQAR